MAQEKKAHPCSLHTSVVPSTSASIRSDESARNGQAAAPLQDVSDRRRLTRCGREAKSIQIGQEQVGLSPVTGRRYVDAVRRVESVTAWANKDAGFVHKGDIRSLSIGAHKVVETGDIGPGAGILPLDSAVHEVAA